MFYCKYVNTYVLYWYIFTMGHKTTYPATILMYRYVVQLGLKIHKYMSYGGDVETTCYLVPHQLHMPGTRVPGTSTSGKMLSILSRYHHVPSRTIPGVYRKIQLGLNFTSNSAVPGTLVLAPLPVLQYEVPLLINFMTKGNT